METPITSLNLLPILPSKYSIPYPIRCYILSKASLSIQIKLSQSCKDLAQQLRKQHNYQVDSIYLNNSPTNIRVFDGSTTIYAETNFLLRQTHPFIVMKEILIWNETAANISRSLSKIDYSNVEEIYITCSEIKFEDFEKLFVPSLKLIAYWSSNVIAEDGKTVLFKTAIDEYVQQNYPNVQIHEPD